MSDSNPLTNERQAWDDSEPTLIQKAAMHFTHSEKPNVYESAAAYNLPVGSLKKFIRFNIGSVC